MLAGYLPFDDDPDNPEGDNINLLYKYIVTTPLTFPEYVTPHARDLLKRILVANPRTRADLFEVARHSWLEEYSNITSLITSTATDPNTLSQASVDQMQDGSPQLARSASVREPTSRVHQPATPTIGRLIQKQGTVDAQAQGSSSRTQRDAKRRTVQLEYVAPQTQTARTTMDQPSDSVTISNLAQQVIGRRIEQRDTQARQGSRPGTGRRPSTGKEAYPSPSTGNDRQSASAQPQSQRRPSTHENGGQSSSSAYDRPATSRDPKTYQSAADNRASPGPRPGTQGSMMSNLGRSDSTHLASRGSYNRPAQAVAPSLASTTAQGRLSQPPAGRPIFTPSGAGAENAGQSSNSSRTNFEAPSAWKPSAANTHKRSSTLSGLGERLFGKSSSSGAGRLQSSRVASDDRRAGSRIAGAPPTSSQESSVLPRPSRTSTESRRSSFGFARRGSASGDKPKRFSLIPSSFRNLTSGESRGSDGYPPPSTSHSMADPQRLGPDYPIQPRQRPGGNDSDTAFDRPGTSGTISKPARSKESMSRANGAAPERGPTRDTNPEPYQAELPDSRRSNAAQTPGNEDPYADRPLPSAPLSRGYDRSGGGGGSSRPINGGRPGVLHKPNRKFTEAYENEGDGGGGYAFGGQGGHGGGQYGGGSSGAARKVMDFFRRRGRARDGH